MCIALIGCSAIQLRAVAFEMHEQELPLELEITIDFGQTLYRSRYQGFQANFLVHHLENGKECSEKVVAHILMGTRTFDQ